MLSPVPKFKSYQKCVRSRDSTAENLKMKEKKARARERENGLTTRPESQNRKPSTLPKWIHIYLRFSVFFLSSFRRFSSICSRSVGCGSFRPVHQFSGRRQKQTWTFQTHRCSMCCASLTTLHPNSNIIDSISETKIVLWATSDNNNSRTRLFLRERN